MNREEQIGNAYKECAFNTDISHPWYAFKEGARWADAHPKEGGVEMWIARNDNNQLVLSEGELGYNENGFEDGWENKEDDGNVIYLRSDLFPEVTFANSPQRVRLTLVKE